jgi:hypothetical protein
MLFIHSFSFYDAVDQTQGLSHERLVLYHPDLPALYLPLVQSCPYLLWAGRPPPSFLKSIFTVFQIR